VHPVGSCYKEEGDVEQGHVCQMVRLMTCYN